MSKVKFQRATKSSREIRRMAEREATREQRMKAVDDFWKLPPEERAKRIADNEAFRRIERNGITLSDLRKAEDDAYHKGVQEGIDSALRSAYAAICMALHELHGFGKQRCRDVLNLTDEKITMALTSEDIINEVWDEIGLKIQFREQIPGERIEEV